MQHRHDQALATDSAITQATADLVGRSGARSFEVGYDEETSPLGSTVTTWYAIAVYNRETQVAASGHPSPAAACIALVDRILDGAMCPCGRPVVHVGPANDGCRWSYTRTGGWQSACGETVEMPAGTRGNIVRMRELIDHHIRSQRHV